jgi:haloalkane dehalogenase
VTDFIRTPDENFDALPDFPYAPHYHTWQDLRMHYVDEGPRDGPVALLLHGMPTWSFLYRDMIPGLAAAGYRCIAPDHMGFGRSDKPTDIHWYTIARHVEILTSLIAKLDLRRVTLVCQDWGGPTGLAQAAMMPDRFERLVIMNTWLHHEDYSYTDAILQWIRMWQEGGPFARKRPNVGVIPVLASQLASPQVILPAILGGRTAELSGLAAEVFRGFDAPFRGLPDEAYNGARRFPLSIPVESPDNGNAAAQACHYRTLLGWNQDVQFIWGCMDDVFPESWGRKWAGQMSAPFEGLADAAHFPQITHGERIVELILGKPASGKGI